MEKVIELKERISNAITIVLQESLICWLTDMTRDVSSRGLTRRRYRTLTRRRYRILTWRRRTLTRNLTRRNRDLTRRYRVPTRRYRVLTRRYRVLTRCC
jgi:hypothetical protein